jgi:DNA replication factor GINS
MLRSSDPMSFEDLSSVYRVEKKSPTLSAVRRDLYPSMAGLVIDLRSEYEKHLSVDPDSIICEGVNQRRKKAVSMSKEITEMRMGKIAAVALIGARGGQNVLDNFTPEEKEYYDDILNISRRHVGIVDRLSGKRRFETPEIDPKPAEEKKVERKQEPERIEEMLAEEPAYEDAAEPEPPPAPEVPEEKAEEQPTEDENYSEDEFVVIRILEDLPPFSGPDRNYELSKEDIVRMPKTMALALINRDKAVLISPGP